MPLRRTPLERAGLQLYTVRRLMESDFDGTLATVARIGYKEVEFAGYFGRPPAQVAASLSRIGLISPSTHIPYANLGETWAESVADALTIGHQYVTIPWLPAESTLDGWYRIADRFNEAARIAREQGLGFAYHNHDFEFKPVEGRIPFDVLLERTDPSLVAFEMDIYWLFRAGHDPLEYLAEYPGRFPLFHVKDSSGAPEHGMVDVGAGVIDFGTILSRAIESGARHFFVEHDSPREPMRSIRNSYAALAALRG